MRNMGRRRCLLQSRNSVGLVTNVLLSYTEQNETTYHVSHGKPFCCLLCDISTILDGLIKIVSVVLDFHGRKALTVSFLTTITLTNPH